MRRGAADRSGYSIATESGTRFVLPRACVALSPTALLCAQGATGFPTTPLRDPDGDARAASVGLRIPAIATRLRLAPRADP